MFLIDLISHRVQRIERIHADTTLEASAGQLSQPPLHLVLQDDILHVRSNMQETVDMLAGEW